MDVLCTWLSGAVAAAGAVPAIAVLVPLAGGSPLAVGGDLEAGGGRGAGLPLTALLLAAAAAGLLLHFCRKIISRGRGGHHFNSGIGISSVKRYELRGK